MWRRIAVPLDGSPCAQAAFEFALEVAACFEAVIDVCVVADPHQLGDAVPESGSTLEALLARVRSDARGIAAEAERAARARGLECHADVLFADVAADEIAAFARKRGAEAIIMGTHGRSGVLHAMLGSVAEQVLRSARCAVVTVRAKKN